MKDQLGNESHFEYDSNRGLTLKEIDAKEIQQIMNTIVKPIIYKK